MVKYPSGPLFTIRFRVSLKSGVKFRVRVRCEG